MNDINLNSLKIFLVVANSKSFLEASNKLFISQPAVSKSISNLESELGVNLFYRVNKGVVLTPQGEILLKYLTEARNLIESCSRIIQSMNDTNSGSLVIGVQSHIVRNYFMSKIKDFRTKYPNISIVVRDLSTEKLLDGLEKREIDFVIDSSPIKTIYNNIEIEPIKTLDMTFIKSTEYDAKIKKISDLENSTVIFPINRSSLRKNLEKRLKELNVTVTPKLEFETEDLIIESVRRNLGIGYVVKDSVEYLVESKQIEYIDFKEKLPTMEINLVYIGEYLNKIAEKFILEEIKNEE